jgi:hypothetical protein
MHFSSGLLLSYVNGTVVRCIEIWFSWNVHLLTCHSNQFLILKAFIVIYCWGGVGGEWEFYLMGNTCLYIFIMTYFFVDILLSVSSYKFCVRLRMYNKMSYFCIWCDGMYILKLRIWEVWPYCYYFLSSPRIKLETYDCSMENACCHMVCLELNVMWPSIAGHRFHCWSARSEKYYSFSYTCEH